VLEEHRVLWVLLLWVDISKLTTNFYQKNMHTYILTLLTLLSFPAIVFASEGWNFSQMDNILTLQGSCTGKNVTVALFRHEKDEKAVYTSETKCGNGTFLFSENFSLKNIPEGTYIVALNGEKSQSLFSFIEKRKENEKNTVITKQKKSEETDTPDTRFLSAFVALQQSLLDMRTWIDETTYPSFIKKSIGAVIDTIDGAVGKMTDLLFSQEESTKEETPVQETTVQTSAEKVVPAEAPLKEVIPAIETPLETVPEVSEEANLPDEEIVPEEAEEREKLSGETEETLPEESVETIEKNDLTTLDTKDEVSQ